MAIYGKARRTDLDAPIDVELDGFVAGAPVSLIGGVLLKAKRAWLTMFVTGFDPSRPSARQIHLPTTVAAALPTELPTTAAARAQPTPPSPPWTEATVPAAANEYANPEPASHWDGVDPEPVYEDGDFIPSDDLLAIDPP